MQAGGFSWRSDPAVPDFPDDRPLVVFDGDCVMCSRAARSILRRDRAGRFRLLAAQSDLGRAIYQHLNRDPDQTMLLLEDGRAFFRSDAVIRIAEGLGGAGRLAGVARIVPRGLRDRAYDWIACNRRRWFADGEACALPRPDQAGRILG